MEFGELWPGGPEMLKAGRAQKPGTDSILLTGFAKSSELRRCADLGCGSGFLMLLLSQRAPGASFDGVEIRREAYDECIANVERNRLSARISVHHADLNRVKEFLLPGAYDLVISNPPYFQKGSGGAPPDSSRAAARSGEDRSIFGVCRAAAYLCRQGGTFSLVHRPERLSELICEMTAAGLEPKRLRMVHTRPEKAPSLVLIEGRRGGKKGLLVEPPFILRDERGNESEEYRKICHR